MSITSDPDPVGAAIDLLEWGSHPIDAALLVAGFGAGQAGFGADVAGLDSATALYPNEAPPDRIARDEDADPGDKNQNQRLTDVSLYVGPAADSTTAKASAKGDATIANTVAIEIWTNDSTTTNDYMRAIMDLFARFNADNNTRTAFYDVYPAGDIVDDRPQGFYYGSFNVETLGVQLHEYRDLG